MEIGHGYRSYLEPALSNALPVADVASGLQAKNLALVGRHDDGCGSVKAPRLVSFADPCRPSFKFILTLTLTQHQFKLQMERNEHLSKYFEY
jgi:hypothetical protein